MTTRLARCLTDAGTQQPSALSLTSPEAAAGPASNLILAPGLSQLWRWERLGSRELTQGCPPLWGQERRALGSES